MAKEKKTKRDYGDGALYQRESDGRWVGSFRHEGKRKVVYGKTRAEAKKKLDEAKRKAEQGTLIGANKQKLTEYLDYWLQTVSKSIEPSTLESYRDHLRRARNVLGHLQIQKVARHHIQQFINDLTAELSTSTIYQIYAVLKSALDAAVRWKMIETNPCSDIKLPKLEQVERPVLTPEQAKHLLKFVRDQPLEPFVVLALGAAMRRGEIGALRWADIDFEKNIIRVERKVYRLRHPDGIYRMTEGNPKSRSSKRIIPLAGFVKEALLRHRRKQRLQRLEAVTWDDRDLVFCNGEGDFVTISSLSHFFKKLLEAAGLPIVPPHILRHCCNTLLRLMGVDAVTRQRIMGHAHIDETEGTYGHTYDEMKQDAMDRLNRLLSDDENGLNFEAN